MLATFFLCFMVRQSILIMLLSTQEYGLVPFNPECYFSLLAATHFCVN